MTRRLIALAPSIALLAAALLPLLLPVYQVTVITYVMIAAVACIGWIRRRNSCFCRSAAPHLMSSPY